MPRAFASVGLDLWAEGSFRRLTISQQRAYLLLKSHRDLNHCGVVPLHYGRLAGFAADDSPAKLRRVLRSLTATRHLVLDEDTGEVLVRTHVRHDGLLAKPNLVIAMVRDFASIISGRIRVAFLAELRRLAELPLPDQERLGLRAVFGEPSTAAQRAAIPTGLVEPFIAATLDGELEPFEEPFPEQLPEGFLERFGAVLSRARDARTGADAAARGYVRAAPTPTPTPPPPAPPPADPAVAADDEGGKINGEEQPRWAADVREARLAAGLPATVHGPWSDRAIDSAITAAARARPDVAAGSLWRAMHELARDPTTSAPGRLAHQLDAVLARLRERDAAAVRDAAERAHSAAVLGELRERPRNGAPPGVREQVAAAVGGRGEGSSDA